MNVNNSDYYKTDASLDSNGQKFKAHYSKQCQYEINDALKITVMSRLISKLM